MGSHHVFSQLVLFALLWLVVLVHLTRPKRPVTAPATPTEEPKPLTPTQPPAQEPKPFEGLTQRPQCALCEREPASPPAPPPLPPDPMTPTHRRPRKVDPSMHFWVVSYKTLFQSHHRKTGYNAPISTHVGGG